jgi:hypothetical protein
LVFYDVCVAEFTDADLVYFSANYLTLEELCADRPESPERVQGLIDERRLPQPSYVLPDGTGMFPADYYRLLDEAGGVTRSAIFRRTPSSGARPRSRAGLADVPDGIWGVFESRPRRSCAEHARPSPASCPGPAAYDWRRPSTSRSTA